MKKSIFVMLGFQRTTPNTELLKAFTIIRGKGHSVNLAMGEDAIYALDNPPTGYDLYVLKSHSKWWLNVAGMLHYQGAALLNPYPSCQATLNKVVVTHQLMDIGIPTPPTWVSGNIHVLKSILKKHPIILKPHDGQHGQGIFVVTTQEELETLPSFNFPMLIQEWIPGVDEILKVYVIGDKVFGVLKPVTNLRALGTLVKVTEEVRQIALACGKLFQLSLYGIEVIYNSAGPLVIDLNYFPSYLGVPNAGEHLANYIINYSETITPST